MINEKITPKNRIMRLMRLPSCEQVRDNLARFVREDVDTREDENMRRHIVHCDECAEIMAELLDSLDDTAGGLPVTCPQGALPKSEFVLTKVTPEPVTGLMDTLEDGSLSEVLRQFVSVSHDAILIHIDKIVVFANDAAARLLGVDRREQLNGRSIVTIVHPSSLKDVADRLDDIQENGGPVPVIEERLFRLDGRTVYVEAIGMETIYRNQRAVLSILKDISSRKRAEKKVEEATELLRLWAKHSGDAMVLLTPDLCIESVSRAGITLFGYSLSDVRGQNFTRYVHPSDIRGIEEIHSAALTEKIPTTHYATFRVRREKSPNDYIWIEAAARAILEPETKEITQIVAVLRDIRERKLAIERDREILQGISTYHTQNLPLAIIEWNKDFRIESWRGEAENMFGWKQEEVYGYLPEELGFVYEGDKSRVWSLINRLRNGETKHEVTLNRNYRNDGGVIICKWYNSAKFNEETGELESFLSLVEDVTVELEMQFQIFSSDLIGNSIPLTISNIAERLFVRAKDVLNAKCGLAFVVDSEGEKIILLDSFGIFGEEIPTSSNTLVRKDCPLAFQALEQKKPMYLEANCNEGKNLWLDGMAKVTDEFIVFPLLEEGSPRALFFLGYDFYLDVMQDLETIRRFASAASLAAEKPIFNQSRNYGSMQKENAGQVDTVSLGRLPHVLFYNKFSIPGPEDIEKGTVAF